MNHQNSLAKACKDLMLKEPFYGLFLMALNKMWSKIGTACVALRGINYELHLDPEFWEGLKTDQHKGLLKHELLHIGFFHLTESYKGVGSEDQYILNIAQDIEINQYIEPAWLPPNPCLPESFPDLKLELKKGTMYYFKKLKEKKEKNKQICKAIAAAGKNGDETCKLPDGTEIQMPKHDWEDIKNIDEATQKLVEAQTGHILNQVAQQVEKSRGTVPGEFKEILERLNTLEPPKFDWRGFMRRFQGKSTKTYTKKSRRKYNKRTPDFPGLKIRQQKHILVGLDNSGSVCKEELKEFQGELSHMYKIGCEITVVQCDTAISSVKPFNPRKDFEITGRGGTDFQPVINFYNEHMHKYSCLFYLTDGEAPAPDNARGNILWVLSSKSNMNDSLPGTVIQLN